MKRRLHVVVPCDFGIRHRWISRIRGYSTGGDILQPEPLWMDQCVLCLRWRVAVLG